MRDQARPTASTAPTDPAGASSDWAALVAIAAALGRDAAAAGRLIATAESCTGGLIAQALTETAGSSAWFDRGYVTYTNAAKAEALGVPDDLLARHGAVSEPVARAMAEGALRRSQAALALAVTGIAGPGGAVPGKPVGTVCFGWALAGGDGGPPLVVSETHRFAGDRVAVRGQTGRHALERARRLLAQQLADRPTLA